MAEKKDKSALKALRKARRPFIEKARAAMKKQQKDIKDITAKISGSDATVPEIATATQIPSHIVMQYIAALKKYGKVAETKKDGDYFQYKAIQI